jgi:hypothetical protein
VPKLLSDATDASLSKTYTIPSTASIPYPTLPITFINMAMYLQAALQQSRAGTGDVHKLAKMVNTCYPAEPENVEGEDRRSETITDRFRNFIGRGNRGNRQGGNLETFDLVSPFVLDDQ